MNAHVSTHALRRQEVGRAAFAAANAAERQRRRDEAAAERREIERRVTAAEAEYRASREPSCLADSLEVQAQLDAAHELAEVTAAFEARIAGILLRLRNSDPSLVEEDPRFGGIVADAVTDNLGNRDLASVYAASLKKIGAA